MQKGNRSTQHNNKNYDSKQTEKKMHQSDDFTYACGVYFSND